jgi:general secretion pathway protein G
MKQFLLRPIVSLVMGLGIALFCFYAAQPNRYVEEQQSSTRHQLRELEDKVIAYRARVGMLPSSLGQVSSGSTDGWFKPFVYSVRGQRYQIVSYGRDGKPGGVGLDCDLSNVNPNPPEAQLSFDEGLLNPQVRGIILASIVCGIATAFLVFYLLEPEDCKHLGVPSFLARLVGTLFGTAFMALCMIALATSTH